GHDARLEESVDVGEADVEPSSHPTRFKLAGRDQAAGLTSTERALGHGLPFRAAVWGASFEGSHALLEGFELGDRRDVHCDVSTGWTAWASRSHFRCRRVPG